MRMVLANLSVGMDLMFATLNLIVQLKASTVDILYDSDADIAGFQFNIDGASVTRCIWWCMQQQHGFTVSQPLQLVA